MSAAESAEYSPLLEGPDSEPCSIDSPIRLSKRLPIPSDLAFGDSAWSTDVVQFVQPTYFAWEGEPSVQIEVLRMGRLKEACSVSFCTKELSAKAGLKFEEASGTLHFPPGVAYKKLDISIIQDESFSTTLQFAVALEAPVNCQLGIYMCQCIVNIIDDDMFPSNKYTTELSEDRIEDIPPLHLFWEFMKFIFTMEGMRGRTISFWILDSFHAAHYILRTYLQIYLVDVVFGSSDAEETEKDLWVKDSRWVNAACVAVLHVVPPILLQICDIVKVKIKIAPRTREFLQSNLFNKYLNFTDEGRQRLAGSELAITVIQECDIVGVAYEDFFAMIRKVVRFGLVSWFVFSEQVQALYAILMQVGLVGPFLLCRIRRFKVLGTDVQRREHRAVRNVTSVSSIFRLIADYEQRPKVTEKFWHCVEHLSGAKESLELEHELSRFVPELVASLCTACYIMHFASDVISGKLSVGRFLAMTRIITELGLEFKELYEGALDLVSAIAPLQRITHILNGETDLMERREQATTLSNLMLEKRQEVDAKRWDLPLPVEDAIPIVLSNVQFRYDANGFSLRTHTLRAAQGDLIAVLGARGAGKSTLLKLVAGIVHTEDGHVFYPPHLRMLYVSKDPILVDDTLWENLTFGGSEDPQRVFKVLSRLHLDKFRQTLETELSDMSDDPRLHSSLRNDVYEWRSLLSTSDPAMIHIARAFVYNPNILVMNKPTHHFSGDVASNILATLAEFVQERGIEVHHELNQRRPRLCFYSSDQTQDSIHANHVWEVIQGNVMKASKNRRSYLRRTNTANVPNESTVDDDVHGIRMLYL
eukprot:TRINITY_DN42452_c0_g1_i1.p1 TRINITY_DN42452_c0_g1~~TRINITY_DN42452_c0_g1_i1.p1  ORF type:complete len:816 (+),score=99.86 TRINITY_DN42452_c0_g1_i1:172-2619(+)